MTAYNPKYSQKNEEYRRAKYKRVALDYDRTYYDQVLKPAADRAGLPVGSWIKEIVYEYLKRRE